MLALLTAATAVASTLVAAQSTSVQLVTREDTARIFGGSWTGACTPVSNLAVTCAFNDPSDASRQVSAEVVYPAAVPGGTATFDAWRTSMEQQLAMAPDQWTAVDGIGDGAYIFHSGLAGAQGLQFFSAGALGFVATTMTATDQQLTEYAKLVAAQVANGLPTASGGPQPPVSSQPPIATQPPVTTQPPDTTPTPVGPQPTAVAPVAPGGTPPQPPPPPSVVAPLQVAGPTDISLDPVVIATSVAAAAGVVLLVPFPAALFNSTLEEKLRGRSGAGSDRLADCDGGGATARRTRRTRRTRPSRPMRRLRPGTRVRSRRPRSWVRLRNRRPRKRVRSRRPRSWVSCRSPPRDRGAGSGRRPSASVPSSSSRQPCTASWTRGSVSPATRR